MKYVSLLLLIGLLGCVKASDIQPIPPGYKACRMQHDCDHYRGEFCGFIKMNTPPVCRH